MRKRSEYCFTTMAMECPDQQIMARSGSSIRWAFFFFWRRKRIQLTPIHQNYTQYIPLSIYELQTWVGNPSIYVFDCSSAGLIVNWFLKFAEQREREQEVSCLISFSHFWCFYFKPKATKRITTTNYSKGLHHTRRMRCRGTTSNESRASRWCVHFLPHDSDKDRSSVAHKQVGYCLRRALA